MSGAIPSLHQYTFMAWCSVKVQGHILLNANFNIILPHGLLLRSGLFLWWFSTKILYGFLISPYSTNCHSPWFNHPNIM